MIIIKIPPANTGGIFFGMGKGIENRNFAYRSLVSCCGTKFIRMGIKHVLARFVILIAAGLFFTTSCNKNTGENFNPADSLVMVLQPKAVKKTVSQKIYMHYMPWFEDKVTSGNGRWGMHWTMNTQNPDIILPDGRRQIASFFYPLIGTYASSDPDLLRYHLLLMKYAGVDGVIVDWYGTHRVADYPLVKRNTDSLFKEVHPAGMQLAICYEDATLKKVTTSLGIDTITAAKTDMDFLQSAYFADSAYVKINGKPLLLCFGPQVMKKGFYWEGAFSAVDPKPCFLSLAFQGQVLGSAISGEFAWISPDRINGLDNFYQNRAPYIPVAFSAAFPGFKDFGYLGGWGDPRPELPHNGATTLQQTLAQAKASGLPYIQLETWNDFGEGTMIEPTVEFGYSFLEAIQQYTGVAYTGTELELICKWYMLKKKYNGNSGISKRLMRAYYYLVSLDTNKAKRIIDAIE